MKVLKRVVGHGEKVRSDTRGELSKRCSTVLLCRCEVSTDMMAIEGTTDTTFDVGGSNDRGKVSPREQRCVEMTENDIVTAGKDLELLFIGT